MQFTYDHYKHLKQTKLFLKNPQGNNLGWLSGVKGLKLKIYFNSVSEMSFKMYEYSDGTRNEYYDLIETLRLIEMQYIAIFQIQTVNEITDENGIAYKEVSCKSLENELINKYVDDINGVFSLYDVAEQNSSLLHIIAKYCNWTIGHVDQTLQSKWRTFAIDSSQIYNLLTGDIAKSFNCIFQFDTFNRVINAYELSSLGELTDVVISNKNILKQYVKKSDLDKIITKMRVRGGTNSDGTIFDLRSVNPDGTSEIINVNYYKTSEWMSSGLLTALDTYQTAYDSYITQHSSALALLQQYQAELNTLENELIEILSQIKAQDQVIGASSKLHGNKPPVEADSDYTIYQNAITLKDSLITQKVAKENEVSSKESQISTVETTLENIATSLDRSNYFTSDQSKELECFLTMGNEYSDETYQAVDTMTQLEIINMKLELKANAESELVKVCRPQYTIETNIDNLWTIQDDKDSKISYQLWREKLTCGNIITLKFRSDFFVQVRLMIMEIDFDNLADVSLTFSDKNRLDDELSIIGEILKQSESTSKTFSVNYYGFDKAAKSNSEIRDFMNDNLNATKNRLVSNNHEEFVVDEFGAHMKRFDTNTNTYSPYQSWWQANTLLFSSDGFRSAEAGIGEFVNSEGETFYGILAPVVVGQLLMSEKLYISNSSGTYTINQNGLTCTATVGANTYSTGMNPSVPSEILFAKVNGVNKFYIDTINNQVVLDGKIISTSGSIGGWDISATGLTSKTSGSAITLYNSSNNYLSMKLNYVGLHLYNQYSGSNEYIGGMVSAYTASTGNNGVILVQSPLAEYLAIGYINSNEPTVGSGIGSAMYYTKNGFTGTDRTYPEGFNFISRIYGYGGLTIQDGNIVVRDSSNNVSTFGTSFWRLQDSSGNTTIIQSTSISTTTLTCTNLNGYTPIHSNNLQTQMNTLNINAPSASCSTNSYHSVNSDNSVNANNSTNATYLYDSSGSVCTYVSSNDNLIPSSSVMCIGSSTNRWSSGYFNNVYNSSGLITSSDERLKNSFKDIDDRYMILLDTITPYLFKYNDSTSDRFHMGMKAQELESIMTSLGLTSQDCAALVKDPIYEIKNKDGEYDKTSSIIDYQYYIRYEEFVAPLIKKSHIHNSEISQLKEIINNQSLEINSLRLRLNEIEKVLNL